MTDTPEPDKSSLKTSEKLIGLLDGILLSQHPVEDLIREFISRYKVLPVPAKQCLFDLMLRRMEVQKRDLVEPIGRILDFDGSDHATWTRLVADLRRRLRSPRLRALSLFIRVTGGIKFLLDLRADVLAAKRSPSLDFEPLDEELTYLFDSWFQHGFLFLEEISRESSFCQIRFLKEHDMVHPMEDLEEIWDRLGSHHRCFALYHKTMPEEPIVFIEAALTKGVPESIHEILELHKEPDARKGKPDTAVFYSINNTQSGLAGLGLGKILIFDVIESVLSTETSVKRFCTISPVPGFWPQYLRPILRGEPVRCSMSSEKLLSYFPEKTKAALRARHEECSGRRIESPAALLLEILQDHNWIEDPTYRRLLRWPLTELTYYYIIKEKNSRGRSLNPVAGFHLGNGATVSRGYVRFAANRSERGMEESCGMMVNYMYSRTLPKLTGSRLGTLLRRWRS